MSRKTLRRETVHFERFAGGGQTIGTADDGRKVFAWGALPGETAVIDVLKSKKTYLEGVVAEIVEPSENRVAPQDAESYLSTSPWQIVDFASEQAAKSQLIKEAFELHHLKLDTPEIYSDEIQYGYRNKMEFSWWWTPETDQIDLAFYRRGSHSRIPVEGSGLAHPEINRWALIIRDILRARGCKARQLKTLLIRSQMDGKCVAQLYVKDPDFQLLGEAEREDLSTMLGFQIVYSDPRSPASVTTTMLQSIGAGYLEDKINDTSFRYAVDGFFQVNLPVYEQALADMRQWLTDEPVVDMYAGVGTIGLSIVTDDRPLKLVELNKGCVDEMQRNISDLKRTNAKAIHAASEEALEHIDGTSCLVLDRPRAGLHTGVIDRLLETKPQRVIYLSCNPVTQARDISLLQAGYKIAHHKGYNFFPRTPHIEHLVVLDKS